MRNSSKGFTLIELLVVIAIIGLLSSVVLASLNTARAKARDSERLSDLVQIRNALEAYADDHKGKYPVTTGKWFGNCSINASWGVGSLPNTGSGAWIADLAPKYIPVLPTDPKPSTNKCYIYTSNGTNYMVMAYLTVETYSAAENPEPRPSQPTLPSFSLYSQGAKTW
jgi:prepilin-type N-terminal cleavage/methylation domain-containing protein